MKSMDGAAVFKALADENRVDIVRFIARHPGVTASALLDRLDIAQSTLSHHMKVLLSAGIVVCKRKGKWTHYSINIETVDRIERFVGALRPARPAKSHRARPMGEVAETETTVIRMNEQDIEAEDLEGVAAEE
ncbi:ArsR/SmtB family transcription factor [Caniella muris]|uniref:ArsR/SmtB family transcription factor n=1 Tax=Caniella muris TaxID=2941502 RepID=UPI00203C2799|nr:metalloregulator ArsR/SmtB family transcription factor [Caniella muris]